TQIIIFNSIIQDAPDGSNNNRVNKKLCRMERESFLPLYVTAEEHGKPTQLLMLTNKQIADFQKHYQTEAERFHILPPGIYPDRK
ncbi:hypothetical protein MJL48_33060, partial [Salmonella enterica subsp. enterica serovar Kentucky]|nr:hypothetical protein [Salmonella enterica subsp. enterica serovar Kentucky]